MTKIRSTDSKRIVDKRPEWKKNAINKLDSDTNRKVTEAKQPGLYPGSMKVTAPGRGRASGSTPRPPVARKRAPSSNRRKAV